MGVIETPSEDEFWELLNRLAGTTYGPQEADSTWQRTLRAWSVLLRLGRESIDRAFRQAYPELSDELIADWERTYKLPNDIARTLGERQRRVADTERYSNGASCSALEGALGVASATAQFSGNLADSVSMSATPEESVFHAALHLTNEEFYNPAIRAAAERVFGRAVPARNIGQLDDLSMNASSSVAIGIRLADEDSFLDRDAIIRQESVAHIAEWQSATTTLPKSPGTQPARMKSFGPGTVLKSRDLNRIQEGMLASWLNGDGLDAEVKQYVDTPAGLVTRWFSFSATNNTEVVIDDELDWRDRFLVVHLKFSDGTDIRPGGGADTSQGVASTSMQSLYTGPGGTAGGSTYTSRTVAVSPNNAIYARNTDGALCVRPSGIGGSTRYGLGVILSTHDMGLIP